MRWADAGGKPPCAVCPKVLNKDDPKPLAPEDDFGDWIWGLQKRFRECRAVGDFEQPDPLLRSLFAEFDLAERRQQEQNLARMIVGGVLAGK